MAASAGLAADAAGWAAAARSSTLLGAEGVRTLKPKYASASVLPRNTVAMMAVAREKKLALPDAPKMLPEAPLPKAAPISAPLPCCIRINPTMMSAEITCATCSRFRMTFIEVFISSLHYS